MRWSSPRNSSPAVLSRCPARHFATPLTTSNHLPDSPYILHTHIASPLRPSSCSNEPATSRPPWEWLTSNPCQSGTSSSMLALNHGKCISKAPSMSSTTESADSGRSDAMDLTEIDIDDATPTLSHLLEQRGRPKRKYTHLLDDVQDFDRGGKGYKRMADCVHTSEIIDSGGDTRVPGTIAEILIHKARAAKVDSDCGIVNTGCHYRTSWVVIWPPLEF